jgi:hypothetical protein
MIQVAVKANNLAIHTAEKRAGPGSSHAAPPNQCELLLSHPLDFVLYRTDGDLLLLSKRIQDMYKLVQLLVHY